METQLNPELVGREFDKWLDWNGTADESNTKYLRPEAEKISQSRSSHNLPISPISTAHSDSFSLNASRTYYTAPSVNDFPTPSHSSGSPELPVLSAARLSGETIVNSDSQVHQNRLKRKLSSSNVPEIDFPSSTTRLGGSKRPHNVIEKRYRANLNEKIAELRDSVPALRVVKKTKNKNEANISSGEEELDGLIPSNKLNKASILTKAVEYIRHLEFRTKKLEEENRTLKDRLQILDKVIADGGNDATRTAAFTSSNLIEPSTSQNDSGSPSSEGAAKTEIKGLIGLPDNLRQFREIQSQEHYGHIYASPSERSRLGGKWPTRIMLGSLAGLMVMEGFGESDQGDQSREKALFGIPLEILDGWTFLRSPRTYLAVFANYYRAGGIFPLIKGFMALSILAFLVFAYMFNSKPTSRKRVQRTELDASQPTQLSSPIENRRRAWSTSMQTLHLPHHSFFPEWLAVTSEWINYSFRYWIGPRAFTWLTGLSTEDEVARIKAWDIAIDAQLAGGDPEVSRSRAVLTIFGSGTLPRSPYRLMMKAIHCRLVLWNVGLPDTLTTKIADYFANWIAERQWRNARHMHESLAARDRDRLPGYLNYLLQMDYDDVFSTTVTQRAYNLMYDRPSCEMAENILMDVVVEDHAIRSPLDAIAAWCSTSALHEALGAALQNPEASDLLREHIQAALEIAPPGSAAETRALAVHSVLSPGRRQAFYQRAADAISSAIVDSAGFGSVQPISCIAAKDRVPFFIDSSTPVSARPEIATCLSCAEVMLKLEQDHDLAEATRLFSKIRWPTPEALLTPSLLSTASLYFTLHRLVRASGNSTSSQIQECTPLALELYQHFRDEVARMGTEDDHDANQVPRSQRINFNSALDMLYVNFDTRSAIPTTPSTPQVKPSATMTPRRHSNASNDTGYASLEEETNSEHTRMHSRRESKVGKSMMESDHTREFPIYTSHDTNMPAVPSMTVIV